MPLRRRSKRHGSRSTQVTTTGGQTSYTTPAGMYGNPLPYGVQLGAPITKTSGTTSVIEKEVKPTGKERLGASATGAAGGAIRTVSSNTHGGILFWALLLLVAGSWSGFWRPTLDAIWGTVDPKTQLPTAWKTSIDGKLILGGIVFCVVLAMIANSSDTAGSLIALMLFGLWLIFLTQNAIALKDGKAVPVAFPFTLIDWFSSGSQTGGGSGGGGASSCPSGYQLVGGVCVKIQGGTGTGQPGQHGLTPYASIPTSFHNV